jgi:DNA-binding transcriptional LysR family regulator
VGIAYMIDEEVRPWIEAGQLKRVLKDWSPKFPGFHLYYPSRRQLPAPLRALVDFLRREDTTHLPGRKRMTLQTESSAT